VSKKIALFTPFNPVTGGGGTIFRSLIPQLEGAEVHWFYLAESKADIPGATLLGSPVLGGAFVGDALNSARIFVTRKHPMVLEYARKIMEWEPEVVWVNAMNEGLLMGMMLRQLGANKLHVSVHDDPAGLANKSRRYRHLAGFMDRSNRALLQIASSVDVVSEPMKRYYSQRYGVTAGVVYRYLGPFSVSATSAATEPTILVGHVGSAYSAPEVRAFLAALRSLERTDGVRFKVLTFGQSPVFMAAQEEFPGLIDGAGDVPELEVVKRLRQCVFVYSMYSFNRRHRIFRETSQPTKMSTYLMAARPILAHCPEGSSTIEMMTRFKLGACVTSMGQDALINGILRVVEFNLEIANVQAAIDCYCGKKNIDYLEECFGLMQASVDSVSR